MRETSGLMLAKIFAATVLLICIGMAVHMALPLRGQLWLNARLRRAQWQARDAWQWLSGWRHRRGAKKTAEAAIKRARAGSKIVDGEWDGNVYRPKNFDPKQRDKRDLH